MPRRRTAASGSVASPQAFPFADPHRGQELLFTVVPVDRLEVIAHQRKPSTGLVRRLMTSIERLGFLVPVVAVPKPGRKGEYVIIDGQHRFLAARELGLEELPVIVVPEALAERMMNLNIEKEPNIREKAHVALAIYRQHLQARPEQSESDPEIVDTLEHPYFVTLGIAYEQQEKLVGSAFEQLLRRCDGFVPEPLRTAYEIRTRRAAKLLEADRLVRAVAARLRETGTWHPYVYHQIVTAANPHRRKRTPVAFDALFDVLLERLRELERDPQRALGEAQS
ncbi:MAG: ParB/RepB/Spo0J family partition protein [Armatimonadota bacterium]|nr:ParB/RepB/Spo0J family partition protein [Armatimonadota bacterium]MDR7438876.1 ParB/RepB/Spo0J family partition protein [Armatimonadota bacterium]MDR7562417.1 ParB/RepB/Spo0J family partition protein [Armatimonadota bacterium]MDR7568137.1 ParB/RepB/Spo0J family partition protein [Armatimonadota bacterium]MDR7601497.1 ParB/RepB/Spo0J family partition protein [Armatimonadota bacterium]